MTEKLRSHLKKEKGLARREAGFTLIELLVVIAIIAILVVIVLVAINPIKRIADANKQSSSSAVNQIGKAAAACITDRLGQGIVLADVTGPAECGTVHAAANPGTSIGYLKAQSYTNLTNMPNNVGVKALPAGCTVLLASCVDVCVAGSYTDETGTKKYNNFQYTTGTVAQAAAASC